MLFFFILIFYLSYIRFSYPLLVIYSPPYDTHYSQSFISRPTESKLYLYSFCLIFTYYFYSCSSNLFTLGLYNTQSFISHPTEILTYLCYRLSLPAQPQPPPHRQPQQQQQQQQRPTTTTTTTAMINGKPPRGAMAATAAAAAVQDATRLESLVGFFLFFFFVFLLH